MSIESNSKEISRRRFLRQTGKTALVGGAAVTLGGGLLTGCGSDSGSEVVSVNGNSGSEKIVRDGTYSWEYPPEPITDIKEVIETELLVIGGGNSGINASLMASELGAKVMLLQKSGDFVYHGMVCGAINSRYQKELGVTFDPKDVTEEYALSGGGRASTPIIDLYSQYSGKAFDWMMDKTDGMYTVAMVGEKLPNGEWSGNRDHACSYRREINATHGFKLPDEFNGIMKKLGEVLVADPNVDVRFNTPAAQLIRENGGRVSGAIAKDEENGGYIQINASKGIILATGDYGANPEMIARYCIWADDIASLYMPAVNTGDGHLMGKWIGGKIEKGPHATMIHNNPFFGPFNAFPWLYVNKFGVRYMNEDVPNRMQVNGDIRQPDNCRWQIIDSGWKDQWQEIQPRGFHEAYFNCGAVFTKEDMENAFVSAVESGNIHQADTIEELAKVAGIDENQLVPTVDRYNEFVDKGYDDDFLKTPEILKHTGIKKGPFFAIPRVPMILCITGGLEINKKTQVLDEDYNVIEGLYAAGNVAGGMFAYDYGMIIGGMSNGRAMTFGQLAAKAALGVSFDA